MTNCTGAPADQYLEDYLQGTLPEGEAVTFEEHYFECPVCLAHLEALQAVQRQLRSQPQLASRKPIPWPVRFTMIAAIAATLIAVVFTVYSKRQQMQPAVATLPAPTVQQPGPTAPPKPPSLTTRTVSQLADLALPAFRLPNLRGQSGNSFFEAGMRAYASQDCPPALKALSQVPAEDEASTAAHFYSGACLMHEGDFSAASRSLRGVADAGDSPQQEAAFYYLAQIALAGNDAAAARRYLARTIALRGDLESRARSQLAHMPSGDAGQ
jgi:hypothetical protein